MKLKQTTIFLLLFIALSPAFCQKVQLISDQLIHVLDSIASKDVPSGAPGVATGVVLDGKIIFERYYGFANLKDNTRIGPDSRFNIASNGKQYTALAIMKLIEEKQLNLDDDIQTFFPQLFPNIKEPIQIQHLLNHSSGIRDVYDLWSLKGLTWWEHTFDNADALSLLQKQEALNFKPGSKYSYSNSNYILLAQIVEKVTGQSFVNYTNKLFRSIEMPNTSFVSDHTNIDGAIAKPYFNFDTWFGYDWIWNIHGDGNIFSTLRDQLAWEKIVQSKESKGLSKSILTESQSLIPGSIVDQYGYGLEFGEHQGMNYKYHGGATGAWKAITVRFPELNLSIVTLTNSGKTDPMGQTLQMVDALLGIDPTVKTFIIEPEEIGVHVSMDDVLGLYQTDFGYIMKFVKKDGELYMQRSGRNDIKLLRESDNVFHQWNDAPFKQEFTKNKDGKMQITAYYPTVPPFTLTRIESDLSSFDFNSLNGKYVNSETDVSFKLKHIEKDSYQVKVGKQKMTALLITPTEMLVNDYRLKFSMDNQGGINELSLTSGRIQNVKFTRVD